MRAEVQGRCNWLPGVFAGCLLVPVLAAVLGRSHGRHRTRVALARTLTRALLGAGVVVAVPLPLFVSASVGESLLSASPQSMTALVSVSFAVRVYVCVHMSSVARVFLFAAAAARVGVQMGVLHCRAAATGFDVLRRSRRNGFHFL